MLLELENFEFYLQRQVPKHKRDCGCPKSGVGNSLASMFLDVLKVYQMSKACLNCSGEHEGTASLEPGAD